MGAKKLERRLTRFLHGSNHPHYRQPIWRVTSNIKADSVAMSTVFHGDPHASRWTSRTWRNIGVLGVRPDIWNDMKENYPDGVPALLYRIDGGVLRVGRLASHEELGTVEIEGEAWPGHGLRIGRDPLQFAIGLSTSDTVITPPKNDKSGDILVSQGPIHISDIEIPDSQFTRIYFSS